MRVLESFAKGAERRCVLVVPVNVVQEPEQFLECCWIKSTVFLEAVLGASAKLIEVPTSFSDADDGHIEVSSLDHRLQRRENLLVREIASRAKENEGVRMGIRHELSPSGRSL